MLLTLKFLFTKPSTLLPPQSLANCLHDIKLWTTSNLLRLKTNKTELIVVSSKVLLQKVGDLLLDVDGCSISPSMDVRNLGVIPDSTLSFQSHKLHQKISFLSSKKHLQTPALPLWTCGWDPHPCLHHLLPRTTVMEFCPGSLPKPWTSSSMCRTLLPGSSPAPSPGNTSPPLSSTVTGSQLNHASLTKFSSWPINLTIPSPSNICLTSSSLIPGCCTHQTHTSSPSLTPNYKPSVTEPSVWQQWGHISELKSTNWLLWRLSKET